MSAPFRFFRRCTLPGLALLCSLLLPISGEAQNGPLYGGQEYAGSGDSLELTGEVSVVDSSLDNPARITASNVSVSAGNPQTHPIGSLRFKF